MRESIKISSQENKFKMRSAAVILRGKQILVVSTDDTSFFCLPGGYVELNETSEEALIRELKEETETNFQIKQYLGVIENYFVNKKYEKVHELSFYYLVEPLEPLPTQDFSLIENDKVRIIKLNFKWVALTEINSVDIRPAFLKNILLKEDLYFSHHIIKELGDKM